MDIAALKNKLEESVNCHREGESLDLWQLRQRECSPTRPIFWRILIRTLRKFLVKVYSVALAVGENFVLILAFSQSGTIETDWLILCPTPPKLESPGNECDRTPPKGFVPLPDVEIGGCARNDSLIRSLIF
jgi:hypothetical protein